MSQQPLLNGPAAEFNPTKDDIIKDMPKPQQNGNGPQLPLPPGAQLLNAQRPLIRNDSRTNFPYRPQFPNQQQPGTVPPRQIRPPVPQQFPPRNPVPIPGQRLPGHPGIPPGVPSGQGPPPGQPFPGNQQRANFRPLSPFPRPGVPNQRPPGIFQQRSVPAFGAVRHQIPEEGVTRSQTLDSSETEHPRRDDIKNTPQDYVKAPSIAAMNNRSYSLSSNAPDTAVDQKEESRRRSVSSVDSYGEGRPSSRSSSRQELNESTENLDKKEDVPSRPESRSASRMNKILEDEDRSPSSLTEVSQKSVELTLTTPNSSSKSETKTSEAKTSEAKTSETKSSESSNKPPSRATIENGTKEGPSRSDKFLDLGESKSPRAKSPRMSSKKSEGDNDSGVDESTQGNDPSSNGDNRTPRKSAKSRTTSSTPVARSLSRGSKSPSLKSPDSNATTPGSATEKKKIPMNKVQVGHAPSPNLKVVRSKIGSLENAKYKPGGGNVKIETKKVEIKATPRIEAKNDKYVPKGGEKKIVHQKLQWNAKSKIGSLENASHKPKGGEKKIESIKLDFKDKAKPKVGSKDNIKHVPGGGDIKSEEVMEDKVVGIKRPQSGKPKIKNDNSGVVAISANIETKKIEMKVSSKIGSLDNVKHRPGGGDKKIFDDKDYIKQMSTVSSMDHSLSASQNSIPSQPDKIPVADENLNQER